MNKTKVCTKCKKRKKLKEFSKAKKLKDGYQGWCKECNKKFNKENREHHSRIVKKWAINHKEELKKYRKRYYEEHKENHSKQMKKWYKDNQDKIKKYYEENKEEIAIRVKKYQDENKEKTAKRMKKYREENKEKLNSDRKKKYDLDENFRIRSNLRTRLNKTLKGTIKSAPTLELLGCSIEFLKKHLESQFKEGMNWNNHSKTGWHIDHIKPCSKFDLSKPEEQRACFSYSNLQPLWAEENIRKGVRYQDTGE